MELKVYEPGDATRYVVGVEKLDGLSARALHYNFSDTVYLIAVPNFGHSFTICDRGEIWEMDASGDAKGVNPWTMRAVLRILESMGCKVKYNPNFAPKPTETLRPIGFLASVT